MAHSEPSFKLGKYLQDSLEECLVKCSTCLKYFAILRRRRRIGKYSATLRGPEREKKVQRPRTEMSCGTKGTESGLLNLGTVNGFAESS